MCCVWNKINTKQYLLKWNKNLSLSVDFSLSCYRTENTLSSSLFDLQFTVIEYIYNSFIHPKRVLRRVRSSAFSFNIQYPLFSLRSFTSCLNLLRRLPIISITPSFFPSITYYKSQFLCKIWPDQLAFLLFIIRRIFLSSLPSCNSSLLARPFQLISILLQHHISKPSTCLIDFQKCPSFGQIQTYAPNVALSIFVLKVKSNFLVKDYFFLILP